MSKKARLSRDQKRSKNWPSGSAASPASESLAYTGNRYKSEELTRPLFRTEGGIYEAYVMSGREMTDDAVEEELEELIEALRNKPAAELIYAEDGDDGRPAGYAVGAILSSWRYLLEDGALPPRDDLVGILRTILGSLETWRSRCFSSRGYLNYLEGFMNKMGVKVERVTKEGEPILWRGVVERTV